MAKEKKGGKNSKGRIDKKEITGKKEASSRKDQNVKKVKKPEKADPDDVATYSDGHPHDAVQYLEAKLILKPDCFTSVESFRDFGRIVKQTAASLDVGFISDPKTGLRPEIREIVFGDTPDFRLYNNSFILRRRISYVDGFPVGDPEIVFKFRHPDELTAAALDVRPRIAGNYRIKFKAEVLPLQDRIGGYRILYSHNCVFGLSQSHDRDQTSMATLSHVFPALAVLKKSDDERITVVSESIVEEVLLELGQLDFGGGTTAKCNVALWRTRGEHMPLVGEFAFQSKFERKGAVGKEARKLCEQFYIKLQYDVQEWLALGTTKTGMVYRLKGNMPQSHE
jgi:hypothetical protein